MPLQDSPRSLTLANPMKITVSQDGQQSGPYSVEEINARLRAGELKLHDWAWMEGASDWVPLGSITGIDGTAPAAPVAVKPRVPSAVPVVANPSVSHMPSAKAVAGKPTAFFNRKTVFWMVVIVLLFGVIAGINEDDHAPVGPMILFCLFVFLLWYLFIGRQRKQSEQVREEMRQRMQRLESDGAPYIEGQIIRLAGVSGLAKGGCAIRFESANVGIFLGSANSFRIPYGHIQLLQIRGKGHFTESVDGGFIGGGFGIGGALQGIALASALNAAVSSLTRKERVECELLLKWTTGELLMLNQEYTPEIVSYVLQPIVAKLG